MKKKKKFLLLKKPKVLGALYLDPGTEAKYPFYYAVESSNKTKIRLLFFLKTKRKDTSLKN